MWDLNISALVVCVILLSTTTEVVRGRDLYLSKAEHWMHQEQIKINWQEEKGNGERNGSITAPALPEFLIDYLKSFLNIINNSSSLYNVTNAIFDNKPQFISGKDITWVWTYKNSTEDTNYVKPSSNNTQNESDSELTKNTKQKTLDTEITHATDELLEMTDSTEISLYTETNSDTSDEKSMTDIADETDISRVDAVANSPVKNCVGEGYELSSAGSCYNVHLEWKYWSEAFEICSLEGGYLVILNNDNETKDILELLEKKLGNMKYGYWTGFHKPSGGEWQSIHGNLKDIFKDWANDYLYCAGEERCACMNGVFGKLSPFCCDRSFYFICEKDI